MRWPKNPFNPCLSAKSDIIWTQDGLPVDEDYYDYNPIALSDAVVMDVAMDAVFNPLDAAWYTHVVGCPPPQDLGIGGIALSNVFYS